LTFLSGVAFKHLSETVTSSEVYDRKVIREVAVEQIVEVIRVLSASLHDSL
jgi:hypothetical protein